MNIKNQTGNALRHFIYSGLLVASAMGASGVQAAAVNNDLVGPGYSAPDPVGTATNGTSTTVNGAVFTVAPDNTGTGTGAFNPFLRTHETGNSEFESGFNTDASGVLDNIGGVWTHSVQLSDLTTITYNGDQYIQLFLDLGEPDAKEKSLLSMLELELWVNDIPNDDNYGNGLGTKVWDLDGLADTTVNLDYNILSGGNGKYDINALFNASLFAGFDSNQYFYLYNKFGIETVSPPEYATEGTFEEWAFDTTGSSILFGCNDPEYQIAHPEECGGGGIIELPEPTMPALMGIGLLALGFARRVSKK